MAPLCREKAEDEAWALRRATLRAAASGLLAAVDFCHSADVVHGWVQQYRQRERGRGGAGHVGRFSSGNGPGNGRGLNVGQEMGGGQTSGWVRQHHILLEATSLVVMDPPLSPSPLSRSLSGGSVFLGPWEGFKAGGELLVKLDGFGFGKWFTFAPQKREQQKSTGQGGVRGGGRVYC